jgi:hypothetical protein
MQTLSGSGSHSAVNIFTAPMPSWYDFRSWLTSYAANGSAGLVLHLFINGVEVAGASNPAYVYAAGLPFGTTAGIFNTLTAFGTSAYKGCQAWLYLGANDVVSVTIGTAPGAAQPSYSFEFTGQRLGDEF